MSCDCSITTLPDLEDVTCPEGGGQVGKIAFQFANNPFTDISDNAEWLTALAAIDSTKLQVTPELDAPLMPASEALTKGGNDNSTFNGAIRFVGDGSVQFTAELPDAPTSVIKKLRDITCLKDIGVYFITNDGVWSTSTMSSLDIESIYTSSRGFQGLGENDINTFTFSMKGNWQDDALFTKTTWTPTDLKNG